MTDHSSILPYALVPEWPGVYVCGCAERWVSIYLQAVRALNLAYALIDTGRLEAGSAAAVVGGGFAGLSVATALATRGVRVTVVERGSTLLAAQRANRVRSIHPHIHEWPRPVSRDPRAGLPLLDWDAGLSADVARQVLSSFARHATFRGITVALERTTRLLGGPQLAVGDATPRSFDAVILALGVGVERSFAALPLRSYWADDDIATETAGPPRHHLVTGLGEGGVIDTLYLALRGFAHAEVAARLREVDGMDAVERALLAIESDLAGARDDEANRQLLPRYLALPVPAAVDGLLSSRLRADVRLTLNGPEPQPLAARADILNRFLLSRLVALGAVRYRPGRITDVTADGPGYRVAFDGGPAEPFDAVNIRHGTVPALRASFPEVWATYQPVRDTLPHLVPEPMWPARYFSS